MNSVKQCMNSSKQCVNSEPYEVTVHAQKKKKKKKTWTQQNAEGKQSHSLMRQNCNIKIIYDLKTIRALPLNVPNAKYLTFGTPNTKKHLS